MSIRVSRPSGPIISASTAAQRRETGILSGPYWRRSCSIWALATQTWWALLAVPVSGYFFAWVSHAFVERNKPATWTYPVWSLMGDYRMFWCFITGKLDAELERAGVTNRSQAADTA